MEDNNIVELFWRRNESAIAETELKYGKYLHSISYRILTDAEDARECVNDTYNASSPSGSFHLFREDYTPHIYRQMEIEKRPKAWQWRDSSCS